MAAFLPLGARGAREADHAAPERCEGARRDRARLTKRSPRAGASATARRSPSRSISEATASHSPKSRPARLFSRRRRARQDRVQARRTRRAHVRRVADGRGERLRQRTTTRAASNPRRPKDKPCERDHRQPIHACTDERDRDARRARGFEATWLDAHKNTRRVPETTLHVLLERLGLPCATRRSSSTACPRSMPNSPAASCRSSSPPRWIVRSRCRCRRRNRARAQDRAGKRCRDRRPVHVAEGRAGAALADRRAGISHAVINDHHTTLAVAPSRCYTIDDAWRALHDDDRKTRRRSGAWRRRSTGCAVRAMAASATSRHSRRLRPERETRQSRRRDQPDACDVQRRAAEVQPVFAIVAALSEHRARRPGRRTRGAAARAAIEHAGVADEMKALEAPPLIDWPRASKAKLAVFRALFDIFSQDGDSPFAEGFRGVVEGGGRALEDHARFEAMQAAQLKPAATATGELARRTARPSKRCRRGVRGGESARSGFLSLHAMARREGPGPRAACRAGRRHAVGLIADLAVGCDSAGSHAWSYRDEMLTGVSVGAPPDLFNQAGQSWDLPRSHHARCARRASPRSSTCCERRSRAGGIRIDHILGLRRLWLVPDGEPAGGRRLPALPAR